MWRDVKIWSERLMRIDMRDRDGHTFTEFIDANMEFVGAARRGRRGEDAPMPGRRPDQRVGARRDRRRAAATRHIAHEVGLFIAGGAETTRTAIAHGLRAFVDHPDQWEAMAADPSLVPGRRRGGAALGDAAQQHVPPRPRRRRRRRPGDPPRRPASSCSTRRRTATKTCSTDPFTFDIRRNPNPQIAFGFGTHLCIGTHVARATLAAVFTQMSRGCTDLRVVSEPDVEPNIFARAVASLPLGFTAP